MDVLAVRFLTYASVICALACHFLSKRREPTVLAFLFAISIFMILGPLIGVVLFRRNILLAVLYSIYSLLILLLTLILSVVTYRLSPLHPLKSYPGPLLASVTKWWAVYLILFRGGRHKVLQELHSKYGPWIRIGPNEISVNQPDAIPPIYLHLSRSQFYTGIPKAADTLITIIDRKQHAKRRRAWNKALARSNLPELASITNRRILQFINILKHTVDLSCIDFHEKISLLLMDVIGDLAFSGGIETMKTGKDTEGWIEMLNMGAVVVAILGQIPWASQIVNLLPKHGPIAAFHSFALQKFHQASSRQELKGIGADLLSVIVNDHYHGGYQLSDSEAAADASLLIASSLETTSQAITTLFRYIITNREIFHRLQSEIDMAFDPNSSELDCNILEKLPYLHACVQEALRIIPPAPAGPPRSTGPNGVVILGRCVPPNTTISVPTYTLHRDPNNFKDPNSYLPERWLDSKTPILPHCTTAFVPFSMGFGACVGKQLALQNIKLVVAQIIRHFTVKLANSFSLIDYDHSYKERGLWIHDPFLVSFENRLS